LTVLQPQRLTLSILGWRACFMPYVCDGSRKPGRKNIQDTLRKRGSELLEAVSEAALVPVVEDPWCEQLCKVMPGLKEDKKTCKALAASLAPETLYVVTATCKDWDRVVNVALMACFPGPAVFDEKLRVVLVECFLQIQKGAKLRCMDHYCARTWKPLAWVCMYHIRQSYAVDGLPQTFLMFLLCHLPKDQAH
jgi:hypothetical protein